MLDKVPSDADRAYFKDLPLENLWELHEELFEWRSRDRISRRISLKIFREVERRREQKTWIEDLRGQEVARHRGCIEPCSVCGATGMHKCCPMCGISAEGAADIQSSFGWRTRGTGRRPQPWCRRCRGKGRKKNGSSNSSTVASE